MENLVKLTEGLFSFRDLCRYGLFLQLVCVLVYVHSCVVIVHNECDTLGLVQSNRYLQPFHEHSIIPM